MRHTTAKDIDSGVDLIYMQVYLAMSVLKQRSLRKADAKRKRRLRLSVKIVPPEKAEWDTNIDLKQWLKTFNENDYVRNFVRTFVIPRISSKIFT